MTLAVMTRATRGHTGYPLTAPPGTVTLYIAIALAALLRIAAALLPDAMVMLLNVSGALWVAGFVLFVALYGPMLVRPRG